MEGVLQDLADGAASLWRNARRTVAESVERAGEELSMVIGTGDEELKVLEEEIERVKAETKERREELGKLCTSIGRVGRCFRELGSTVKDLSKEGEGEERERGIGFGERMEESEGRMKRLSEALIPKYVMGPYEEVRFRLKGGKEIIREAKLAVGGYDVVRSARKEERMEELRRFVVEVKEKKEKADRDSLDALVFYYHEYQREMERTRDNLRELN